MRPFSLRAALLRAVAVGAAGLATACSAHVGDADSTRHRDGDGDPDPGSRGGWWPR